MDATEEPWPTATVLPTAQSLILQLHRSPAKVRQKALQDVCLVLSDLVANLGRRMSWHGQHHHQRRMVRVIFTASGASSHLTSMEGGTMGVIPMDHSAVPAREPAPLKHRKCQLATHQLL